MHIGYRRGELHGNKCEWEGYVNSKEGWGCGFHYVIFRFANGNIPGELEARILGTGGHFHVSTAFLLLWCLPEGKFH